MPSVNRCVAQVVFHVGHDDINVRGGAYPAASMNWLDASRREYGRSQGIDFDNLGQVGFSLRLVDFKAQYQAPVRVGDLIHVTCWVEALGVENVTWSYEIVRLVPKTLLMTGQTNHVCLNGEGQLALLPPEWKSQCKLRTILE